MQREPPRKGGGSGLFSAPLALYTVRIEYLRVLVVGEALNRIRATSEQQSRQARRARDKTEFPSAHPRAPAQDTNN